MQGGSESSLELWLVCQDSPSIQPGCTSAHFMPLEAPGLLPFGVKVLLVEMERAHTKMELNQLGSILKASSVQAPWDTARPPNLRAVMAAEHKKSPGSP